MTKDSQTQHKENNESDSGSDVQDNNITGKTKLSKEEKQRQWKAQQKKKNREKKQNKNNQVANEGSNKSEAIVDEINKIQQQNSKQIIEESNIKQSMEEVSESKENDNEREEAEDYGEEDQYLLTGKFYDSFKHVFQNFKSNVVKAISKTQDQYGVLSTGPGGAVGTGTGQIGMQGEEEIDQNIKKIKEAVVEQQQKQQKQVKEEVVSRQKRKQLRWLKVAQLKALVKRPDLVEAWDITAPDPLTLVYLKSVKNTVPVPRHWSQKRKFLQNQRGILKPPFRLPEFIQNTGIAQLRDPFNQRDGSKMIKQKLRERMNPQLGKIDIDYEVLHDAFFQHQSQPKLSGFGDTYYQGKEEEVKSRQFKPGKLSAELRSALGISDYTPPPWIINMQRFGPPPGFPNLKIYGIDYADNHFNNLMNRNSSGKNITQPGVYATFKGFEEDEDFGIIDQEYWGQVAQGNQNDENGGDQAGGNNQGEEGFGGMEPDFEEQLQLMHQQQQNQKDHYYEGSGVSSIISGMQTPEVDLRQPAPPINDMSKPLYQVLEQIESSFKPGQLTGGHTYKLPQK